MRTSPAGRTGGPQQYEIRFEGHLDPRWAATFDGFAISSEGDGTTAVRGPVADQAALHGLLQILRDIALPLISVTPLDRTSRTALSPHPVDPERTAT
jgi:hypothetical protein